MPAFKGVIYSTVQEKEAYFDLFAGLDIPEVRLSLPEVRKIAEKAGQYEKGVRYCILSTKDMRELGVEEGDAVEIASDIGKERFMVKKSRFHVPEGQVHIPGSIWTGALLGESFVNHLDVEVFPTKEETKPQRKKEKQEKSPAEIYINPEDMKLIKAEKKDKIQIRSSQGDFVATAFEDEDTKRGEVRLKIGTVKSRYSIKDIIPGW